jgi:fucose 4-O-acetylase-like acetyltransferase
MNRLISIDIAKALCIILVVVGHYKPDHAPQWYLSMIEIIYSFHMPLFMFASGYVYWATRKPVEYGKFILKKIQRLMIPYFFLSILIISIKLLTESHLYLENPTSWSSFYEMFYSPAAGFFLWFVYALFLIFLIIPAFNTTRRLVYLLIGSLVLFFLPVHFPRIFCLEEFRNMLFYFVAGCCVFAFKRLREGKINILIPLFIFTGIYILKSSIEISLLNKVLVICLAISGIAVVLNVSRMIESSTKHITFFLHIATCSYTIYLFHTTFEGFAKSLCMKIPFTILNPYENHIVFIIYALIVITTGLIAPILLHSIALKYSRLLAYLIGARKNSL